MSAAKKEGVDEEVSKYDGEQHTVCMHGHCTHSNLRVVCHS